MTVTEPVPRDVWATALASDPFALVTQSPAWVDAACRLGYEDASRLYRCDDGRLLVLPLVRRHGLRGPLSVRSSFGAGWGMGGPLAAGGVTADDVALVAADLAASTALRTLVHPNPLLARAWSRGAGEAARALPRLAHVLDLSGGYDEVWHRRFTHSARSTVRRGERAGVVVERGSSREQIEAFYTLLERSVERWAARQHEPLWLARLRLRRRDPIRKFHVLAETLGDAFGLWVARIDGRPVSAAIVLRGLNAHYTRGATDVDVAGRTGASYVVQAAAIRDACDSGCAVYHLGETGASTSLAFFKTRFGAKPLAYADYRFERLPLTAVDRMARSVVKRAIGFSEAGGRTSPTT